MAETTNHSGNATRVLAAFQSQIQELEEQITAAGEQIASAESEVDQAEGVLDAAQSQKKDLAKRKNALQRLVDGYQQAQQKNTTARQEAQAAIQSAREVYQATKDDLHEQLSEAYRQALDDAVAAVNAEIVQLGENQAAAVQTAAEAKANLDSARWSAKEAEKNLSVIQEALRGLAAQMKAGGVAAKKAQKALSSTVENGPAKDAYLQMLTLGELLDGSEVLLDPGYEAGLSQKLQEAWSAYHAAQADVSKAEAHLESAEQDLSAAENQLNAYDPQSEIEALIEAEEASEAAPVEAEEAVIVESA